MTKVSLLLALFAATFSNFSRGQSTCNWESDTCPWQNDGECDDPEFCDPNTDCFDCDPCQIYRFDCTSCIASGSCYWLPELGWCSGLDIAFSVADGDFTSEDWVQTCDNVQGNVFDDPLYSAMKWSYDLINVEKVWEEGVFGNGVHIRFNDDGLDPSHPEFVGKFDSSTCSGGYEPLYIEDDHGTATASIAAGNRNDVCAVGIAPDATVSACNIANLPSFSGQFFLDANINTVDISSSSLGRDACYTTGDFFFRQVDDGECPFEDFPNFTFVCETCDFSAELTPECQKEIEDYCTIFSSEFPICLEYLDLFLACEFNTLTDGEVAALTNGIANGRDGKGIVYVFSAGNEFSIGEDLNFEGWLNSRFTITVGAVGKFGEKASYSSTGSALFITAPGGDFEYSTNNVVAKAASGGTCQDITIGTSFSCPVVSGVVALMLEVNPDLGWRDVQAILASTAQLNEPDDETWTTNGAGLHHSINFGFGLVDAYAAVTAARTWQNYGAELQLVADSGTIDISLGDNGEADGTVATSVTVADTSPSMSTNFTVESVVVYLDVSHGSRGHLEITLTSPQGTESILTPAPRPENTQLNIDETWKLMTVRSWGESPFGDWKLSISDEQPGDVSECVDLPWLLDGNATCLYLEIYETDICADGAVLDQTIIGDEGVVDDNGLNPVDSCCVCGGGRDTGEVEDVLKSWKLMIYGHSEILSQAPPSSKPPTAPIAATSVPVTTPTEAPLSPVPPPTDVPLMPVAVPTDNSPVESPTTNSPFEAPTSSTDAPVSQPIFVPVAPTTNTCNWSSDTCPYQNDGECDDPEFCEPNTDCFDCDPCGVYRLDCNGCVINSCYWLPDLGWCISNPVQLSAADGNYTTTDWVQTCTNIEGNVFDDPLYSAMKWSYDLINVEKVWEEGVFGTGVHIRFNDDGIDPNHPEFAGKFDTSSCVGGYEILNITYDDHGTATASIAAGNQNDECAVGIAPGATVSACNIGNNPSYGGEYFLDANLDLVDISSNSIGLDGCFTTYRLRQLQTDECPFTDLAGLTSVCDTCDFSTDLTSDCESEIEYYCNIVFDLIDNVCLDYLDLFLDCEYNSLTDAETDAITRGIAEGRGGKGIVYVFSAGNEYSIREDLNFEGWLNSRFTITVGAVGKFGEFASYSSTGAALFIAAPGGDSEYISNNLVANPGGGCHDITVGTSFSCPVVSGVVALMLEVNPDLGWRDVQGILAKTAQLTEPDDESWTTNGAGLHHSIKFGFGIVDAYAAVTAARTWQNYGPEEHLLGNSGSIDLPLGDGPSDGTVTTSLNITDPTPNGDSKFVVESVVLYLELSHASRGDLEIILTSPQGTESVLHPGKHPETTQASPDERWKLMTVRSWGESPFGDWSLAITDTKDGDFADCLDLPWALNENVTCSFFDFDSSFCADGAVVDPDLVDDPSVVDPNGLNPIDSCCACGGGQSPTEVVDVLKSWKLMVYGNSPNPLPTPPPTNRPTVTADTPPTAAEEPETPTDPPVDSPVEPPADSPTTSAGVTFKASTLACLCVVVMTLANKVCV